MKMTLVRVKKVIRLLTQIDTSAAAATMRLVRCGNPLI